MTPFDYQRASSAADAVARIGSGGAFLAGGTNLVDHLRLGLRAPSQLVDISRLPLDQIRLDDDGDRGRRRSEVRSRAHHR